MDEILREVVDIDHGAVREHACSANDMLEFPYVTRPGVALQNNQGARGGAFDVLGELGAELADKVAGEERDIF